MIFLGTVRATKVFEMAQSLLWNNLHFTEDSTGFPGPKSRDLIEDSSLSHEPGEFNPPERSRNESINTDLGKKSVTNVVAIEPDKATENLRRAKWAKVL